tara:strand:- start:391 stop:606 length:216 start_codon:yes stop_codon:yes gene_type:complete
MSRVAGRAGIEAAEMEADEAAVDVAMVVAGVPATMTTQRTRQVESPGDVAASRHLELAVEGQLAANTRLGQ